MLSDLWWRIPAGLIGLFYLAIALWMLYQMFRIWYEGWHDD